MVPAATLVVRLPTAITICLTMTVLVLGSLLSVAPTVWLVIVTTPSMRSAIPQLLSLLPVPMLYMARRVVPHPSSMRILVELEYMMGVVCLLILMVVVVSRWMTNPLPRVLVSLLTLLYMEDR